MKKFIIPVATVLMGLTIVPGVSAMELSGESGLGKQSGFKCTSQDNVYNCEMNGEGVQDIVIKSGETLILDLKGNKLTNYCEGCAAIDVQDGGTLVLKDTSGSGSVTTKEGSTGTAPTINNAGTTTIEGGIISSARNGAAAILNLKNMTISGGTIKSTGDGTTLDASNWGITNQGSLTIAGGTFDQQSTVSLFQNEGEMTIENGTFTAKKDAYALITNSDNGGATPELAISGGDFETTYPISSKGKNDNTTISGGTFANTESVIEYLAEGLEFNEDGTVVAKTPEDSTTTEAETENVENPNTADSIATYVAIATIAVLGLSATAVVAKKNR